MAWSLLEGLGDEDRRHVLSLARRRTFARGEVVFHEGDPGNTLHLVEKGHFSVRRTTPLGDVAMLRIHGPGGFFGELSVLEPGPRSATITAVTKGETVSLSDTVLDDLRRERRAVDHVFMGALIAEVRRLSESLTEALYVPAPKRVVRRLVELAGVFGTGSGPVDIPLTQEELAQLAGTTRQTANRVLRTLEDDALVTVTRGRIVVAAPDALVRRGR